MKSLATPVTPDEKMMTADEAADFLRVSSATLSRWRADGSGPKYIKLGVRRRGPVRYRFDDLAAFLDQGSRRSTAEGAG